ncbi:MAG TPA: class I SAM-dependent methyltransferase [Longimicrobiaceae bacterium]|nr:class I SAM-dependent methyltransferase [Longimicrobiaceae bacterium]
MSIARLRLSIHPPAGFTPATVPAEDPIPHPTPAAPPAADPGDGTFYDGRDLEAMSHAVRYHHWVVGELAPYLGRDVAEIGAGTGNVSRLLLDGGIGHLTAVEPSPQMYPLLRRTLAGEPRATVLQGRLGGPGTSWNARFDSIVYLNVLEHVDDDAGELRRAYAALRPGGHLCIFVPALQWLYGRLDAEVGHRRRYHRAALGALVKDAGFDIVRLRYFDAPGVLPWFVLIRLLRRELNGTGVGAYDRWVVPIARAVERIVPPPIGKNLLCIARKPA